MESPVLTLVIALLVAVNVESQRDVIPPPREFPLPPPRPLLSPLPESPPPRLTTPPSISRPPPETPHSLLRPPPLTPLPPPRASLPRPLSQSPSPLLRLPPPPRKQLQPALPEYGNHDSYKKLSPPLETEKPNMGKKIGLMFIGVAAILQFCILAFLLIRRRQLLKTEHGY